MPSLPAKVNRVHNSRTETVVKSEIEFGRPVMIPNHNFKWFAWWTWRYWAEKKGVTIEPFPFLWEFRFLTFKPQDLEIEVVIL